MDDEHDRLNERARNEYIDKREAMSLVERSVKIDKMDYEANKKGSIIIDYDKFRRAYIEEALLILGVMGLYFMIGLAFGVAIVLS